MADLTVEQIEQWRERLIREFEKYEHPSTDEVILQVNALCDLALKGLAVKWRPEKDANKDQRHLAYDKAGTIHIVRWNSDSPNWDYHYWDHGGNYSRSMIYSGLIPLIALGEPE
jgi:hypothetical protein